MKAKATKKRAPATPKPTEVKINHGPAYATERVKALHKLTDLASVLGDPPAPSEPTLIGRAQELMGHLDSAFIEIGKFRSSAFGEAHSDAPRGVPTTLSGLLARACEQAASLVGELRTINSRLDK